MQRAATKLIPLLLVAMIGGCGESLGPNGEQLIAISDDVFEPNRRAVAPGETVLWQWKGSNEHNVTWVATDAPAGSPTQVAGSYSRSFTAAGTYIYYCSIHGTQNSGMYGVVTVSSGGGTTSY